MKKIKFLSINKKKILSGVKMICLGTTIGVVALFPSKIKSTNTLDSSSVTSSQMSVIDDVESTDVIDDVESTGVIDNLEESEIEEKTEPIQEEIKIDIKNYKFSNDGVSVYNTDFKISEDLTKDINNYINNFGGDCSFIAINLNDGMSFGYNVDKKYPTASTIKAAFSLYSFKQMDSGNGTLEELKVYEERFRRDGSGVLKNQPSGVSYSLKDLFYYTINYSDNVAYYMVHDRFYDNSYNEFLNELGCKNLYLYNGARWGYIDARSMALIWQEIYKYKDETENGKFLFELLTNAEYNYIEEGMENYKSAHKSGWTPTETHDSGIVFAKDDYIVVTLNNNNGNYSAKSQLLKISNSIEKVIDEYTNYKENSVEIQKRLVK